MHILKFKCEESQHSSTDNERKSADKMLKAESQRCSEFRAPKIHHPETLGHQKCGMVADKSQAIKKGSCCGSREIKV